MHKLYHIELKLRDAINEAWEDGFKRGWEQAIEDKQESYRRGWEEHRVSNASTD